MTRASASYAARSPVIVGRSLGDRRRTRARVEQAEGPDTSVTVKNLRGDVVEELGHRCGMVFHMKTTLNIDDSVMQRLREEAARRGTTMSTLVEAGLRRVLAGSEAVDPSESLTPLPTWNGGKERVDISDREALYRVMEEE